MQQKARQQQVRGKIEQEMNLFAIKSSRNQEKIAKCINLVQKSHLIYSCAQFAVFLCFEITMNLPCLMTCKIYMLKYLWLCSLYSHDIFHNGNQHIRAFSKQTHTRCVISEHSPRAHLFYLKLFAML